MKPPYKRRFIEDDLDPHVQKLNKENNKISKISMKTQKYILKQLYELMPLRSRIKFHERFGGDCLGDIYGMLKI